jgi:hypothetical protein
MTWYAAHLITYFEFNDKNDKQIPVWENIVLIEANSDESASEKAKKYLSEKYESYDSEESTLWDGFPGNWRPAGIRKVIECECEDDTLSDGIEVTYSQYICQTEDIVNAFVQGDPVSIVYEE